MGTNYHPPKLVKIPSKGNKWFVVVTKPMALQEASTSVQVRRSTKTTDRRQAEAAQPGIASQIYQEFDAALQAKRPPITPTTFKYLTDDEVQRDPTLADPFIMRRMLPPLPQPKDPSTKLSRFIETYLAYIEARGLGDSKERKTRRTRCKQFMSVVGDIHLDEIKKVHAYQYAEWMEEEQNLANKTIKSAISRVSMMLVRAEKKGL